MFFSKPKNTTKAPEEEVDKIIWCGNKCSHYSAQEDHCRDLMNYTAGYTLHRFYEKIEQDNVVSYEYCTLRNVYRKHVYKEIK